MAEIILHGGHVVLVDDEDFPLVAGLTWSPQMGNGTIYVQNVTKHGGKQKKIYMHRLITGAGPRQKVDHENGNGLDNRRKNLRVCTNAENMRNMRRGRGASKFKGVARFKRDGRWRAYIVVDYRQIQLGYFDSEIDAANAYDAAAAKHFGEFAKLNSPDRLPA